MRRPDNADYGFYLRLRSQSIIPELLHAPFRVILGAQAAGADHDVGSQEWWKGVNAAGKANDEHMGEEEHEGLADFRRHVDLELRHRLAVRFAAFEAAPVEGVMPVDVNPETYVRENS